MPGEGGGAFPVLPVGRGLHQGLFALLIKVAQGSIAGGQGLLPSAGVVVAGLAGGGGFGVGSDRAQGSVED